MFLNQQCLVKQNSLVVLQFFTFFEETLTQSDFSFSFGSQFSCTCTRFPFMDTKSTQSPEESNLREGTPSWNSFRGECLVIAVRMEKWMF